MSRSFHQFTCEGDQLSGTLDEGQNKVGLLIVSGGNEIKAGAHTGMAQLAQRLSNRGFPVFRYDRRGIGDSEGSNNAFSSSKPDMVAAIDKFNSLCPSLERIIGFGNCDAATALAKFASDAGCDGVVLANPWVIERSQTNIEDTANPPPAAVRARYWERLKNPKTIVDLMKGRINIRKLLRGIKQASKKQENSSLSLGFRDDLHQWHKPCHIILAERDTTARAFIGAWNSSDFQTVREKPNVSMSRINSASHSFADDESKAWLEQQIVEVLSRA